MRFWGTKLFSMTQWNSFVITKQLETWESFPTKRRAGTSFMGTSLQWLAVGREGRWYLITHGPHVLLHSLSMILEWSSFPPRSVKSWKECSCRKRWLALFFMSKIYRVMYLLLAWLLLNLKIKRSDTKYIALSIGFVRMKNADRALSIPWVPKPYFNSWIADT